MQVNCTEGKRRGGAGPTTQSFSSKHVHVRTTKDGRQVLSRTVRNLSVKMRAMSWDAGRTPCRVRHMDTFRIPSTKSIIPRRNSGSALEHPTKRGRVGEPECECGLAHAQTGGKMGRREINYRSPADFRKICPGFAKRILKFSNTHAQRSGNLPYCDAGRKRSTRDELEHSVAYRVPRLVGSEHLFGDALKTLAQLRVWSQHRKPACREGKGHFVFLPVKLDGAPKEAFVLVGRRRCKRGKGNTTRLDSNAGKRAHHGYRCGKRTFHTMAARVVRVEFRTRDGGEACRRKTGSPLEYRPNELVVSRALMERFTEVATVHHQIANYREVARLHLLSQVQAQERIVEQLGHRVLHAKIGSCWKTSVRILDETVTQPVLLQEGTGLGAFARRMRQHLTKQAHRNVEVAVQLRSARCHASSYEAD